LEGVLVSTKAEGEIDGAIRSEIGNFGLLEANKVSTGSCKITHARRGRTYKVNDPSWSGFLAGLLAEVQEALSSV
jgi:hypothetical protein